jgi:hypothetical protein
VTEQTPQTVSLTQRPREEVEAFRGEQQAAYDDVLRRDM